MEHINLGVPLMHGVSMLRRNKKPLPSSGGVRNVFVMVTGT